jgi:hypothetical protein
MFKKATNPLVVNKTMPVSAGTPLLQEANVSIEQYFYRIEIGPFVQPRYHWVIAGQETCSCELEKGCPAISVLSAYLSNGGETAPQPPEGYFAVLPIKCPICDAEVRYQQRLSSRGRGIGWACIKGDTAHYWKTQAKAHTAGANCRCGVYPFPHRKDTGLCGKEPS